jgi:hypothetical protein
MSSKMHFIMPDGNRLSSLLDRAEPVMRGAASTSKSKHPYKHNMTLLFEPQDNFEAAEMAAASKLGARSKRR